MCYRVTGHLRARQVLGKTAFVDEVTPASPGYESTWTLRANQEKPSNNRVRRKALRNIDLGLVVGSFVGRLDGRFRGISGIRLRTYQGRAYHVNAEPQGDFRPPRGASSFVGAGSRLGRTRWVTVGRDGPASGGRDSAMSGRWGSQEVPTPHSLLPTPHSHHALGPSPAMHWSSRTTLRGPPSMPVDQSWTAAIDSRRSRMPRALAQSLDVRLEGKHSLRQEARERGMSMGS